MDKPVFKSEEGKTKILSYYENILKQWPVESEELWIKTRYGSTFIIASGDKTKEPLILLHGSSTNSAMWMGDIEKLSKSFRVYAIDIIGEPGKSDECRPDNDPRNYSNWILDILNELGSEGASFVGNSLGGWMALCFAVNNPTKVKKLVLIATSGLAPAKNSFLVKVIFYSMFSKDGLDKINKMVYGNLSIPEEVAEFGRLIQENYNPRMGSLYVFKDRELEKLDMPTLYIAGEKDALLKTQKSSLRLKRILNRAEIKIIKSGGHVIIDQADDIVDFLLK